MSWIILQVASLFVGQLEEGSPGKDDAHADPHGEAHEAKLQLDLAGSDQGHWVKTFKKRKYFYMNFLTRDQVEPGGQDVTRSVDPIPR